MNHEYSDEEYFGEMKLLFQTKGWEILLADLQSNAHIINDIQATSDSDDLYYRKGQLAVLGYLINLEETVQKTEAENENP